MDDAMDAQDAERYVFSKYMVLRERLPGEEVRFMERAVNITVAKVARIFECRNCGRCCDEKYGVMLNRLDIARMSEALGISQNKFVEMFVVEVDGVPHIAVSKMCSFREGGLCKLYAHRPQACKDYPVKSLLTRAALFVALYDGCNDIPVLVPEHNRLAAARTTFPFGTYPLSANRLFGFALRRALPGHLLRPFALCSSHPRRIDGSSASPFEYSRYSASFSAPCFLFM